MNKKRQLLQNIEKHDSIIPWILRACLCYEKRQLHEEKHYTRICQWKISRKTKKKMIEDITEYIRHGYIMFFLPLQDGTRRQHCTVMPKFHYIYLAQNLLKTRSPTCFEQKKSRGPGLRHVLRRKKVGDLVSDKKKSQTCRCPNSITSILLKTCLKPGLRHVLSRSPTCRRQVRDQKKSGTWSPTR